MKIRVKRDEMLPELSIVSSVASASTKMPILKHCLLKADQSSLTISGSDMEISFRSTIPATVFEPGSIAVPAKELKDTLAFLPEGSEVDIEQIDERVRIRCGKSNTRMVALSEEMFPIIPPACTEGIQIPADLLRKLIQLTIFATTLDQHRYALYAVQFVITRQSIRLIASDSSRMAFAEAVHPFDGIEGEIRFLFHRRTLSELLKMLTGGESVFFSYDENHFYHQIKDRLMVSRVLAGQFPNFDMVIPRNLQHHLVLDVKALKMSLGRFNVFMDESSKRIHIQIENGVMRLHGGTGKGDSEDEQEVVYEGEPIELILNNQHLLDFFNVIDKEEALIEFTDNRLPCLLRPRGESDCTFKYVMMPLKVV